MQRKKMLAILLVMLALMSSYALAEGTDEKAWLNILFMGDDTRSETAISGRTDSMIIMSVNRGESILKMTSIMRDTRVQYGSGNYNRINAAHVFGGPELAIEMVNKNFGTDIEDYVIVNMSGLAKIIDLIGGIDIEVTESERKYTNNYARDYLKSIDDYSGETVLRKSGYVHLNGLLAMSYCRNRYTDNDYGRVMRQQKVLLAIGQKMQNMELDVLMGLVEDIMAHVETSLDNEEMKDLAMTGLSVEIENVEQFRVPADGTYQGKMFGDAWMIEANLDENTRLLREFIYGE